ncbi:putative cross-wall-targeting lipoprotein signal domain-containing protein [Streptococcus caviae]|uniref:LPXTG cell wall anchor domain-containing protein n=1 Tax=Streptococcus sp. 'caviae' TaxID=1915004 RepID=UPI00094BB6AD|nr:LPXTG cell wall anchor domain-containing protein [Streptococcus sp. 'caviae']OLN84543.1 cell wall protein [Streptococcus sp. 'caviae']
MQKKIFSKRKNKVLGLCGTILTAAVIALGAAQTAEADDSAVQAAPETAQVTEAQSPAADTLTQAAGTSAEQTDIAAADPANVNSPSQETAPQAADTAEAPQTSTAEQTAPTADSPQADTANTIADASTETAPAQTQQASAQPAQSAAQTASSTSAADKQESSADEKAGAVYDSVNFNDELESVGKIAQVADVVYNGTRDEYITVDDPSQLYQPDTAEIAKYLNQYLTELRQINGIDFPVPPVNQVMQDFAQARANEEAAESDGLEHDTALAFPQGMTWYEENGHMDNNLRRTNAAGQTIASDQATAYYLALNWFADYFNILNDPNDGLQSFGHAISILSASGSAMGIGIADGQGGEEQSWYAELIFGGTGGTSNEQDFSSQKDADGNWVLYYKGKPVTFLPNTTFHYRTSAAAKKAVLADPQPPIAETDSDPDPSLPQQPAADRTEPAAAYPNIPQAAKPNPGNEPAAMSPAPALDQHSPKTAKIISQAKAKDLLPETGNKVSLLPAVLGMGIALMGLGFLAKRRFNR